MGIALLDSSIVIGALNRDDAIHEAASQAVRVERDRHSLAISALTSAEILVGPLRVGGDAVEVVDRFAAQLRIIDLSPDIARLAAELRAARGLKLPDAVIVATGLRIGADVIVTADARWQGIEKVTVVDGLG
ncbi:MAG TPA: PIN domain-containing protein [Actinomycetota bacterium]|jgi:predicted nucleic acid-binding protein|nr:PIN domain-containing protein [Actinomycetota bacterium]